MWRVLEIKIHFEGQEDKKKLRKIEQNRQQKIVTKNLLMT